MQFLDTLTARRSVSKFDPGYEMTDEEFQTLFQQVALSPSSFNLQHWRFVIVRDPKRKAALREAAFSQEQLVTASAAIVVVGKLNAYEDAPAIYEETPQRVRDTVLPMIEKFYAGKPAFQRDEAIRSASLAAMSLMLAAADMGYATGPMIGFDPDAVSRAVNLDEHHIPVMIIVIGKQKGDLRPRPYRFPPGEIARLETLEGTGLPGS